jgi:hypothetical protein
LIVVRDLLFAANSFAMIDDQRTTNIFWQMLQRKSGANPALPTQPLKSGTLLRLSGPEPFCVWAEEEKNEITNYITGCFLCPSDSGSGAK